MRKAILRLLLAFGYCSVGTSLEAAPVPEESAAPSPTALMTITYVTSSTVYLDSGSEAGLQVGDVCEVVNGSDVVTTVVVDALSSRRAACRRADPSVELQVGMKVRWIRNPSRTEPRESVPVPAPTSAEIQEPDRSSSRLREFGLRGRLGLRYIGIRDRGVLSRDFYQPGIDLRVEGRSVAGTGFGLVVDARAQRTTHIVELDDSIAENRTRVYRLTGEWTSPSPSRPFHVSAGRQVSLVLASIGVFDGAQVDLNSSRWTVGVLAGSQPAPGTFDYSTQIMEGAAFAEIRSSSLSRMRWKLALGAVTSRNEGEIYRDYAALQASVYGRRGSVGWIQEIDWNRGWRREAEGDAIDLTSALITARANVGSRYAVNLGYDNRRAVRLFRSEITPETDFDDRYRQGAWGGMDARIASRLFASFSLRRHTGGSSGEARSATLVVSQRSGGSRDASIHARTTRYEGVVEDGWLLSVGAGINPLQRLRTDVTGGLRITQPNQAFDQDRRENWVSIDLECMLTNPVYLVLSTERSWNEEGKSLNVYASGVYRF